MAVVCSPLRSVTLYMYMCSGLARLKECGIIRKKVLFSSSGRKSKPKAMAIAYLFWVHWTSCSTTQREVFHAWLGLPLDSLQLLSGTLLPCMT